jgi:formylglycine-generating enzyme required for sulfatase activity
MKYEAKNVSGIATSQAANTPWMGIVLSAAVTACSNLGANYHLITNNEWMTIARNLEQVSSNWTGGTVGNGAVYSGHNDSSAVELAASSDDNDGYYGTGNVAPSNQRRTLTLTNDEVIWDFAGNLMERTSNIISCAAANCTGAEMIYDSTPAEEPIQFTAISTYGILSYDLVRPSNSSWTSTQGMGRVWTDSDAAYPSGNTHSILRGGTWMSTNSAGIYAMELGHGSNSTSPYIGFRCARSL